MTQQQRIIRRHLDDSREWQEALREATAIARLLARCGVVVSDGETRGFAAELLEMNRRVKARLLGPAAIASSQ